MRASKSRLLHIWEVALVLAGWGSVALLFLTVFVNCSSSSSGSSGLIITGPAVAGANVMAVKVGCNYANEPCVSVTICTPSTSNCQTIDNILLDTGSYGLRIFSQNISIPLTNETSGSSTYAECISYGDGSADWGPVAKADIKMGGVTASNVPMQIINSKFASYASTSSDTYPSNCTSNTVETDPTSAGFNGILGVGVLQYDCGTTCSTSSSNNVYFLCNSAGTSCANTTAALSLQTTNPVTMLSTDNNGVILELPTIPSSGALYATGSLVLGIGTETNNTVTGVTGYKASSAAHFKTTYKGTLYSSSFIDSGSNGLFFPDSSITQCTDLQGLYCPSSFLNLTATAAGTTGASSVSIAFAIGNADQQMQTSNVAVFPNLGGPLSGTSFDWGLPFFFGRNVYVQFDTAGSSATSTTSSLGTGAYWAF